MPARSNNSVSLPEDEGGKNRGEIVSARSSSVVLPNDGGEE